MSGKPSSSSEAASPRKTPEQRLEEALEKHRKSAHFELTLYVTGNTPRSVQAIANIRAILDQHLPGRHSLGVVDIYQQPGEAQNHQILAAPTLIKSQPEPLKRLIGDLANQKKVLLALDIQDVESTTEAPEKRPTSPNSRR